MLNLVRGTEFAEQVIFVQWFRRNQPTQIWHWPSGESRSRAAGAKIKALGGVRGVPDLFVPEWGLWIEMKRAGGTLSVHQKEKIAWLESVGYRTFVAYGADDAQRKTVEFVDAKI